MRPSITLKTAWDQRGSLIWWSIGVAILSVAMVLLFPAIKDIPALEDYLDEFPEELLALFSGSGALDIATAAGYLNIELFGFMLPALFIVFAVGMGSGTVAGDEGRGVLELLLSEPVSRWRVFLEKAAALGAASGFLSAVLWAGLVVSGSGIDMDIGVLNFAQASVNLWLLTAVFGALALAVGGLTGKRGLGVGITAAVAAATYLLNALGVWVDALESLRPLSPFYHFNAVDPLTNGLDVLHAGVLLGIALVLVGAGVAGFQRRDINV